MEAKFQKGQQNAYDPIKREPKFAHAENAPLWELSCLVRHSHPTVSFWAEQLLKGQLIEYGGDPLLDFGLANFLDRISFKQPKSAEKLAKHRQSMAKFEKPVNEIDFTNEKPEILRKEEEYLYKYMQMKPAKIPKRQVEYGEEDAELEEFANQEIEAEMKRMQGKIDESDDDANFSGEEQESEGQFFDGDGDL